MYLITYTNGTYTMSDQLPCLDGANTYKSLIHFEVKATCTTPYCMSEILTLNNEFVDNRVDTAFLITSKNRLKLDKPILLVLTMTGCEIRSASHHCLTQSVPAHGETEDEKQSIESCTERDYNHEYRIVIIYLR